MNSSLVLANGLVVNAADRYRGHVVIRGGVISEVVDAASSIPNADRVIDTSGLILIPGGVDGHCHIAQTTGSFTTLDDYKITTMAALAGGTTTVLDFCIPSDSSQSPLQAAEYKLSLASEARCDVALHASVIDWDDSVPGQLEALAERGIRSVKLYTTNRGTTMANRDTIMKVLREMTRLDGLTYVHAEHDEIIVDCTERHAEVDKIGINHLPTTRPELAEEASVREVIAMAEHSGAAVYFVHQSTHKAVGLVTSAQERGLPVYSETCPHYFALNDEVYDGPLPEFYACCPPMRDKATMLQLRRHLNSGNVDTVASDHSCYDLSQKRKNSEDIRLMPHGLPGVETRLPVTYSLMVDESLQGIERFVSVFSSNPARLNGLAGKGAIAPGFDADIVAIDPTSKRKVDVSQLHMGTDFSPFESHDLRGWPQLVISGGKVVVDANGITDPGPVGRILPQQRFSEASSWAEIGMPNERPTFNE